LVALARHTTKEGLQGAIQKSAHFSTPSNLTNGFEWWTVRALV
jgi:hypothetical protein